MRSALVVRLGLLCAVAISALCLTLGLLWARHSPGTKPATPSEPPAPSLFSQLGLPENTLVQLASWQQVEDFDQEIARFETVFWDPRDTESLRQLIRDTPLVRDKKVLEIGTGTGLIALCSLQAGARKVVATDVNPSAIANAFYNAEVLGKEDRLETRLVPLNDSHAYSVIRRTEVFDLIISNPPWEDQEPRLIADYALYDDGFALLRSILKDLETHLDPQGKLLLAYGCVSAVREAQRLADEYGLQLRIRDDRSLDALPETFLPGMLLEVTRGEKSRESRVKKSRVESREPE